MRLAPVLGVAGALLGCGDVGEPIADGPSPAPRDACEGPTCAVPVEIAVSGPNASNHSCVRMSDGVVFCWGANTAGQLGFAPVPLDTLPPGAVVLPPATRPAGLFVARSAQTALIAFSCVLDDAGGAACWGSNVSGELGRGSADTMPHPQPRPVEKIPGMAIANVSAMALGGRHACLVGDGAVQCWGSDDVGCAVTGDADPSGTCRTLMGSVFARPVPVSGVGPASLVAAGAGTSCAVAATGDRVQCWGNNRSRTIGDPQIGTTGNVPPTAVALAGVADITQIVMGNAHACVVADRRTHCWGQNNAGQLGETPDANVASPVEVAALAGRTHLTAGGFNLCAYTPDDPDGALTCLGANNEGQLGIGTTDLADHPTPTNVGDLVDIASASIGGNHGCAIARRRADPPGAPRRVLCWGKNTAGQVAQPASLRVLGPVEVALPR
ncbi:MAG: hypothetical protein KIT31_29130 [Deltaproteobacteria bacterium]|nr:hypothetical protein [Deltaproteobacteria bacterium]